MSKKQEVPYCPICNDKCKMYANFAFANKQLITHWVRETMKKIFPHFKAEVVYDVCHNIAKFEKHFDFQPTSYEEGIKETAKYYL